MPTAATHVPGRAQSTLTIVQLVACAQGFQEQAPPHKDREPAPDRRRGGLAAIRTDRNVSRLQHVEHGCRHALVLPWNAHTNMGTSIHTGYV